jgi:hypothetical protein
MSEELRKKYHNDTGNYLSPLTPLHMFDDNAVAEYVEWLEAGAESVQDEEIFYCKNCGYIMLNAEFSCNWCADGYSFIEISKKELAEKYREQYKEIQQLKADVETRDKIISNLKVQKNELIDSVERLKADKERIIGEVIKWKQVACDRQNHEILPMKAEIEELKADKAELVEAFICYLIDNCEGSVIYEEHLQRWFSDFLTKHKEPPK